MLRHKSTLIFLLLFLLASRAGATIIDSSYYGFTVKHELFVSCYPDSIYKYLVLDVGKWWDSEHTWSGKSANLVIQPKANGCFCEKLDNGGSVRHMSVVFVEPGKILRMEGGLGPLQMLAVQGTITFEIFPSLPVSKLSVIYTVGGYCPTGLAHIAPLVDKVLGDQLNRLKEYAEEKSKQWDSSIPRPPVHP